MGIYFLPTFVTEKRNNINNKIKLIMTTLNLYVSNECFQRLVNAVKALNSYHSVLDLKYSKPDDEGYRNVTITSDNAYHIYKLGIEMG